MKWLTAIFVALLLGAALLPWAVDTAGDWIARRHAGVKSINYIPGGSYDFSASRRRTPLSQGMDRDQDPDPQPGAGEEAR